MIDPRDDRVSHFRSPGQAQANACYELRTIEGISRVDISTVRGYVISHSASGKVMLDLSFTSEGLRAPISSLNEVFAARFRGLTEVLARRDLHLCLHSSAWRNQYAELATSSFFIRIVSCTASYLRPKGGS